MYFPMLHGNGSEEARFLKQLESGYVLEASPYIYRNFLKYLELKIIWFKFKLKNLFIYSFIIILKYFILKCENTHTLNLKKILY